MYTLLRSDPETRFDPNRIVKKGEDWHSYNIADTG